MASIIYNRAKSGFADGTIDWDTGTIRIALLKAYGTENPDQDFVSEVIDGTNNIEVATSPNYVRKTLTATVTTDDANDRAVLDASDVTWTAVGDGTESAVAAVVYLQVGGDDATPADDIVICTIDLTDTVLNGGDFTIQFSADGLITLS